MLVRSKRKYYKYTYTDWTQPVLSANGTMGGDSFACDSSHVDGIEPLYDAFNKDKAPPHIYDEIPSFISFYNPSKLKIEKIELAQYSAEYWVKGVFQGSNDGKIWNDIKPIDFNGTPILFEVNSNEAYYYHRFYITSSYSNDTIIGKMVITAQEAIPVESTSSDYDFYEYESLKNYILTRKKRNYYKYGTEHNTNVNGSFGTVLNGVASGFSASNYLLLPKRFPTGATNFEFVFKFKSSAFSNNQFWFNTAPYYSFLLGTRGSGQLNMYISSNATSWDIASDIIGVTTLSTNTWYYVKCTYDGQTYQVYLSTDNKIWNPEMSVSSTKTVGVNNDVGWIGKAWNTTSEHGANTTIDLSQSYININGERWWSGDNYTTVGSWINEGVVSGFSTSNYLRLPETLIDLTNSEIEFAGKFSFTTNNAIRNIIDVSDSSWTGFNIAIDSSNRIRLWTNGNGSSTGSTLSANTNYWFKCVINTSGSTLYLSTNGINYTEDVTTTGIKAGSGFKGFPVCIGVRNHNKTEAFTNGSVDLIQSYIKINGEDWWHGTKAVKSTINDYDFYEDRLVAYYPIVRGTRSYYKQTLNKQDTGTYTFTLDKEYNAKLLFVGNGAGGGSGQRNSKWFQSSGGSGACFEGLVKLPAGTYTVTLGTLGYGYNKNNTSDLTGGVNSTDSYLTDSNGNELIRVGCGARGTSVSAGGVGGTLTLGTIEVLETIKAKNGNQGNSINNGSPSSTSGYALSAYDGTKTGYGAGTGSWRDGGNVYGIAGIFNLILETDINNYDYYEDIGTKIY